MLLHSQLTSSKVRAFVRVRKIQFGGNARLKIYGTLRCSSGKRMKTENRVFFESEEEAQRNGFRPCRHCIKY
ncbi:MAG TPA: Ada metal-binding domain-containing protein [Cyclobacteriaceae bacterium]|nr:Ada metal-binding domain-containing protein [Cyclobacteriaceae bacterium]